jgi:maltooligosyltrehalose trehalohydrolase
MAGSPEFDLRPLGAQPGDAGMRYCVWAPDAPRVAVEIGSAGASRTLPLSRGADGYWYIGDSDGRAGDLYRFRLDGRRPLPDPASRFQPQGVSGPSACVDPRVFTWRCAGWTRPRWMGQTIYEVHVGAMTPEGTFRAAIPKLARIRELGAEAIELMPVADFVGGRNWGYDGVALFAPSRAYGNPDDLRALVDAAHEEGLAVILDVVYNHVGPGSVLGSYTQDYFQKGEGTPWGSGFNLDGPRSGPVRNFLLGSVATWLDEFRIDGLRLDATHAIRDNSPVHLIEEIAGLAHARGAFLIAEDERNTARILRLPGGGGFGVNAAWADDFHHQVRVALTGIRTSYFSGYGGRADDLADTIRHGWTYRGQPYPAWDGRSRGEPADRLPPEAFIYCIENHDQIGNRARGERLEHLVSPAQFRTASMLLCLGPHPVLLFMGQEWAASTPFLFFSDHGGELGALVSAGRQREFGHDRPAPDPESPATFAASHLAWDESTKGAHAATRRLYRACLRERAGLRAEGALSQGRWEAIAEGRMVAVRYEAAGGERLLLCNFAGDALGPGTLPPSLAARPGRNWQVILSSENPGRRGDAIAGRDAWILPGTGALWLGAEQKGDANASV